MNYFENNTCFYKNFIYLCPVKLKTNYMKKEKITGYKVFNPDWTCRGFQFEVGKTFEEKKEPVICSSGFHFCLKAVDCFNYYSFDSNNKVAIVEAVGVCVSHDEDSKVSTNKIKIVKELEWGEVLKLVNTGKNNTGYSNSGDSNSGNRNSGNSNSGNRNSGFFNSNEPKVRIFNLQTELSFSECFNSDWYKILFYQHDIKLNSWVYFSKMTDEEKIQFPKAYVCDGYLKTIPYKEAWKNLFAELTKAEIEVVKTIPNFNAEIFEEITGIKI